MTNINTAGKALVYSAAWYNVPTTCVVTNGSGPFDNCPDAQKGTTNIASGILVFSSCP